MENLEVGDFPQAVHGFHNEAGLVLILVGVDMTPVSDRARDVPRTRRNESYLAAERLVLRIHHGDVLYFGLAGTNSTDDEDIIPFFTPAREAFLEYDLSKLVFNLSRPKKTLVALISSLPLAADPRARYAPWVVQEQASQFFDMRIIGGEINEIDSEIDILMLVQPTGLDDRTLYSIDQYFLRGGAGIIFVDPHSEVFPQPQGQQQQYGNSQQPKA